jgi:hypothetical protein
MRDTHVANKGRDLVCEAPLGPYRQEVPAPLFRQ